MQTCKTRYKNFIPCNAFIYQMEEKEISKEKQGTNNINIHKQSKEKLQKYDLYMDTPKNQ